MTESVFISISDQCELIKVAFSAWSPELPCTNGNTQVVKEFLREEPKNDVRILFNDEEFAIKTIVSEGVGILFKTLCCNTEEKVTLKLSDLVDHAAQFKIVSVNNFDLFIREQTR